MQHNEPIFFQDIKPIICYDPLSQLLGSTKDGKLTFTYSMIVQIAGHSCPTVAGAYLMCAKALETLYKEQLPVRGEIQVDFKEDVSDGVAGVISNVISNITGATDTSGFKGLNKKFARDSLMHFNTDICSNARFTRTDTGQSVELFYNPNIVEIDPKMQTLMGLVLSQQADEHQIYEFGTLWQKRVKKILIDNYDNEELIKVV